MKNGFVFLTLFFSVTLLGDIEYYSEIEDVVLYGVYGPESFVDEYLKNAEIEKAIVVEKPKKKKKKLSFPFTKKKKQDFKSQKENRRKTVLFDADWVGTQPLKRKSIYLEKTELPSRRNSINLGRNKLSFGESQKTSNYQERHYNKVIMSNFNPQAIWLNHPEEFLNNQLVTIIFALQGSKLKGVLKVPGAGDRVRLHIDANFHVTGLAEVLPIDTPLSDGSVDENETVTFSSQKNGIFETNFETVNDTLPLIEYKTVSIEYKLYDFTEWQVELMQDLLNKILN